MSIEKYTKSFKDGTIRYIDTVDSKSNRRVNAVGLNPFDFKPHALKRIIERQIDRNEPTAIYVIGRDGKNRTIDSKCQTLKDSDPSPDLEAKRKKFITETMDAIIRSDTFFIIREESSNPSSPHDRQIHGEER